jgi:hypothetical protein
MTPPSSSPNQSFQPTTAMTTISIVMIIIFGYVAFTILTTPLPVNQPTYPMSCGLTQPNITENYTYRVYGPGAMFHDSTTYYKDLVCTNGTTIIKYQED